MKKFEILIVDDSLVSRLKIKQMISKTFDLIIWEAANAIEAFRLLGNHDIDLILLDVVMPEVDGFKAARIIRSNSRTSKIPIIFISGSAPKIENEFEAFESGGLDYIQKPFTDMQLNKLISLYMRFINREKEITKYIVEHNLNLKSEIEERIKVEAALTTREKQLEHSNKTKDKFFSIVAHDLRNPIGAFKNILEMLVDQHDDFTPEEIKDFLDEMKESSNSLFELLENLLDWSRSQIGSIEFTPMPTHLYNIVVSACKPLNMIAANKRIDIEIDIDTECYVMADLNMITTVIRNLVSNSIKFTPLDGKIKIFNSISKNRTILYIKDSGVGIKQDTIDKLFKIEETVSTLGTNKEKGTGLGLILCQEFIEMHGGKIAVESTFGQGATFYFDLETC